MTERRLEDICNGQEYVIQVQNNYYCNLRIADDKIDCKYRSPIKDHNGLYLCEAAMVANGEYGRQS